MSPIEIRPLQPEGRENPADRTTLRKWRLSADPTAGTLTLTEDRPLLITPSRTLSFPLPATGSPEAVRTLCLASYHWEKNLPSSYAPELRSGFTWRPLFLDENGRVLGWGRMRDEPKASQMWPESIFRPLEALGISITSEQFASESAFNEAHPHN
jgi:hypothetical protein